MSFPTHPVQKPYNFYFLFQISNAPPPVPARLNKAPAIPERKNVPKFSLSSPFESSPFSPSPLENGNSSPDSVAQSAPKLPVKLPPPPQPAHSKRAAAAYHAPTSATQNHTDDSRVAATSNGTYPEIKALTPLQNAALYNTLQQKSTEEGYFRFPKVGSNESFPKACTEEADAYSYGRRKSGKKIPPPIPTCAPTLDETLGGSASNFCEGLGKVPERQDSTLSCSDGGMSQTSSPSYLVRSLESPLLPKVKHHSTNRHSKRKFITDKLFSEINEFAYPKDSKTLSPPDLTKSQSTPGGLQTVVDYQQGASLQYQHKVSFLKLLYFEVTSLADPGGEKISPSQKNFKEIFTQFMDKRTKRGHQFEKFPFLPKREIL